MTWRDRLRAHFEKQARDEESEQQAEEIEKQKQKQKQAAMAEYQALWNQMATTLPPPPMPPPPPASPQLPGIATSLMQQLGIQQQQQNALIGAGLANAYGQGQGLSTLARIMNGVEARVEASQQLSGLIEQLQSASPEKISHPSTAAPDRLSTIVAWRGWQVQNCRLVALGHKGSWEPKQAIAAVCSRSDGGQHPAPARTCSCGYWAFKSLELLQPVLTPYAQQVAVIGTVELWGRVVECEHGYRAEFAYPKELWLLKPDLEYLSWEYGVAVRRLGE